MPKYRLTFTNIASASIDIDTDETDPEAIVEAAYDNADFPTLCAHCAGWGSGYELALGDEWQVINNNHDDPEFGLKGTPMIYTIEED